MLSLSSRSPLFVQAKLKLSHAKPMASGSPEAFPVCKPDDKRERRELNPSVNKGSQDPGRAAPSGSSSDSEGAEERELRPKRRGDGKTSGNGRRNGGGEKKRGVAGTRKKAVRQGG